MCIRDSNNSYPIPISYTFTKVSNLRCFLCRVTFLELSSFLLLRPYNFFLFRCSFVLLIVEVLIVAPRRLMCSSRYVLFRCVVVSIECKDQNHICSYVQNRLLTFSLLCLMFYFSSRRTFSVTNLLVSYFIVSVSVFINVP